MKIVRNICLLALVSIMLYACNQEENHEPVEKSGGTPSSISEVQIVPEAGGAKIYYTLPSDKDLLYVVAEYTLTSGQKVETKSSLYNNFVLIEGLGDTTEHTVSLYAVNRSEKKSEPYEATFKPLAPSFWSTFESAQMSATFGGLNLKAENPERENLAYLILAINEFGEWEPLPASLYSAAAEINYTIRGYDTISYTFGLMLRDRWLNYTDTTFVEIKPLFEEPIPNSGYIFRVLRGDAPRHPSTQNARALWDGQIKGWPNTVMLTQSAHTPFVPHLVTVDVGMVAKLSRIHIWDYPEWGDGGQNVYFARGAPKKFEIYGSQIAEDTLFHEDGSLDSAWVLLGQYEEVKPSGLPEWSVDNDDIAAGEAGFSWDFDITAPPVRYLRIRCLENWEGGTFIALGELQVYGQVSN